jgi:hypothetical protein
MEFHFDCILSLEAALLRLPASKTLAWLSALAK